MNKKYIVTSSFRSLRRGDIVELTVYTDFAVYLRIEYVKSIWNEEIGGHRHQNRFEDIVITIEQFEKHFEQYVI